MSKAVLFWLATMCLVLGGTGLWLGAKYAGQASAGASTPEVDEEYRRLPADAKQPWLKEFTLTERSGKQVSSQDLAGRVYVSSFFFSSCPGTCLQQNQKIRELAQEFGPQGVQFVSITCDPEIDTPSRLREYAHKLNAPADRWWFVTGDLTYISRIAAEIFGIPMDKQTHSEKFFVTDKWGRLRGGYHWAKLDQVTQLKQLLAECLAETTAPPVESPAEPPAGASSGEAVPSSNESPSTPRSDS